MVTGQWTPSNKVIDLPLHKYLQADGERRVRVTTATTGRHALHYFGEGAADCACAALAGLPAMTLLK